MNTGVFVLHEDGTLHGLRESSYASEAMLQDLLSKYPNLLAGDQMDTEDPRRWLLIAAEMGVPGEEEGSDRWAVDHLFLDQDAVPTLVEVKRSSDTRIRREVVGQMLDYAANAVLYWPVETLRARFEKTCEKDGADPNETLSSFLGENGKVNSFWQDVKTNLQAGKVRMVFVADLIPDELRRVVEFLNSQMDPAEVLAVEIKQYTGDSKLKTLVPRVIGQTSFAQVRKGTSIASSSKIDETTFLDEMKQRVSDQDFEITERIIHWANQQNLIPNFNQSKSGVSYYPILKTSTMERTLVALDSGGALWLQMARFRNCPPFDNEEKRQELRQKLNAIPNIQIPPDRMDKYPRISSEALRDETSLHAFLAILTEAVQQIREANP